MWIAPNPVEPGSSLVRVVVQPPAAISQLMRAAGGDGAIAARRMVAWMRRLQEAGVMLSR